MNLQISTGMTGCHYHQTTHKQYCPNRYDQNHHALVEPAPPEDDRDFAPYLGYPAPLALVIKPQREQQQWK
jgi:hypothetical protein